MWQPTNRQWWFLVIAGLLIVLVWPPAGGKSLAVKFVNWAVDPWDELPVLPPPLGLADSHDLDKSLQYDLQAQAYYLAQLKGGWTRKRLDLKVADDPLDPPTQRQLLSAIAVVLALLAWRWRGQARK